VRVLLQEKRLLLEYGTIVDATIIAASQRRKETPRSGRLKFPQLIDE